MKTIDDLENSSQACTPQACLFRADNFPESTLRYLLSCGLNSRKAGASIRERFLHPSAVYGVADNFPAIFLERLDECVASDAWEIVCHLDTSQLPSAAP